MRNDYLTENVKSKTTFFKEEIDHKIYRQSIIPPIIKKIHKKLTDPEYQELLKDLNFLHKTTQICEECYFKITASIKEAGRSFKNRDTIYNFQKDTNKQS